MNGRRKRTIVSIVICNPLKCIELFSLTVNSGSSSKHSYIGNCIKGMRLVLLKCGDARSVNSCLRCVLCGCVWEGGPARYV